MRKMLIALLLVTLPLAAAAEDCHFSASRIIDIDAVGLKNLRANLGSTDLVLESAPGISKIEIRGTACASDAARLKDLQIDGHRSGDDAILDATNQGGYRNISMFGATYAYLKLQVRVPAALAVIVITGSGDVNASGLASLDYTAGSGDLTADHIKGALTLTLGSSDVKAHHVGSVDLKKTGSGDVHISGVQGDVRSAQSGSGDLGFSDVGGNVSIGSSGSGNLALKQIGHNVDIGSTASGDVSADGVGGNFTVHSSNSGDVKHAHVKGKVSVPKHANDGR